MGGTVFLTGRLWSYDGGDIEILQLLGGEVFWSEVVLECAQSIKCLNIMLYKDNPTDKPCVGLFLLWSIIFHNNAPTITEWSHYQQLSQRWGYYMVLFDRVKAEQ